MFDFIKKKRKFTSVIAKKYVYDFFFIFLSSFYALKVIKYWWSGFAYFFFICFSVKRLLFTLVLIANNTKIGEIIKKIKKRVLIKV